MHESIPRRPQHPPNQRRPPRLGRPCTHSTSTTTSRTDSHSLATTCPSALNRSRSFESAGRAVRPPGLMSLLVRHLNLAPRRPGPGPRRTTDERVAGRLLGREGGRAAVPQCHRAPGQPALSRRFGHRRTRRGGSGRPCRRRCGRLLPPLRGLDVLPEVRILLVDLPSRTLRTGVLTALRWAEIGPRPATHRRSVRIDRARYALADGHGASVLPASKRICMTVVAR
jgi:hypothetical protein